MKRLLAILPVLIVLPILMGSEDCSPSSDKNEVDNQERMKQATIQREASSQVGMPAIKNFREKKLLKDILELRDQTGLVTYTYLWNEMQGKKVFFCQSIGYGIPYATQFTNPQKPVSMSTEHGVTTIAQADPNGLFSPASAEGTWIMCKDPNGSETRPVYVEPRVIVSPFKLPE
jgi:hypothetical protein